MTAPAPKPRVIKFRQWVISAKKYEYWGFYKDETGSHWNGPITNLSQVEPSEHFTGLHDKNGKEIYEGDICRIEYRDGDSEIMCVEWDEKSAGFMFADRHREGWTITQTPIEVIGTVHQNPELLQ